MVTKLKSWREQNYYELLEVDPQASDEEIRTAYEKLKAIYSLLTPGITILFTPEEVKQVQDKMEEAYRVLRDPRSQREYDLVMQGAWEKPITPPPRPIAIQRTLTSQQIREALGSDEVSWSGESLGKIRRFLKLAPYTPSNPPQMSPAASASPASSAPDSRVARRGRR